MVTISAATIRANIYETIYDSLTSSLSTGTVTASFIDDDPTFPQVVVNPIKKDTFRLTIDAVEKEYRGNILIELYTKKNKQIDQISDEIENDLYVTSKSALEALT